tara:strand:- start:1161 stop:1364 length:204 start_codon:yes stop_codon:yes gene_type:complete
METSIEATTELAKLDNTSVTLEFPSEEFANIFMENLFVSMKDAGVSKDTKMQLQVIFPVEEDEDDRT